MVSGLANPLESKDSVQESSVSDTAQDYIENPKMMRRNDFRSRRSNKKLRRDKKKGDKKKVKNWPPDGVKPHAQFSCLRRNGTTLGVIENVQTLAKHHAFNPIMPHSETDLSVLKEIRGSDAASLVKQFLKAITSSGVVLTGRDLVKWIVEKFKDVFPEDLYKTIVRALSNSYLKICEWLENITLDNVSELLSNLLTDWEACKKNPAFKALILIITTVVAYKMGDKKKIVLGVGAISFLTIDSSSACFEASTLFEAILHVAKSVTNGLKTYEEEGSLKGFLYGDEPLTKFMLKVSECQALHASYLPGNLQLHHNMGVNEYEFMLRELLSSGFRLSSIFSGSSKSTVLGGIAKLQAMIGDIVTEKAKGELREAPFCVSVFGSSGVGKSTLNQVFMRTILMANGYDHRKEFISYLNPEDKYLSNFKTYTQGAVIDDAANTKAEFMEKAFSSMMIALANNSPFVLNKADIAEKGKVCALLKYLGVTTNIPTLDADVTSNMPSSIVGRFIHAEVVVKEEFRKKNSLKLDQKKAIEKFGVCLFPDVWRVTLYETPTEAQPKVLGEKHRDDKWEFTVIEHNGIKCENMNITDATRVLIDHSRDHFKAQKVVVKANQKWDEAEACETCLAPKGTVLCTCHTDVEPHSLLTVNEWKMTFRDFALNTALSRREQFHKWIESRRSDISQFTMDVLEFAFKIFDNYVEENKVQLRELLIPNTLEEGILGSYITKAFRPEYKILNKVHMGILGFLSGFTTLWQLLSWNFPQLGSSYARGGISLRDVCNVAMLGSMFTCFWWKPQHTFSVCLRAHEWKEKVKRERWGSKIALGAVGLVSLYTIPSPVTIAVWHLAYKQWNSEPLDSLLSTFYKAKKADVNTDATSIAACTFGSIYFRKELKALCSDLKRALTTEPQTALNPSIEEVRTRDAKINFDAEWFATKKKNVLAKLPVSTIRTTEEVEKAISKNVWKVIRTSPGEKTNVLVLKSGLVLFPWHFVAAQKGEAKLTFIKQEHGNEGNRSFSCIFTPEQAVRIDNSDVALCYIPKTQHVRNLLSYFPLKHNPSTGKQCAILYTRQNDGSIDKSVARNVQLIANAHSGCGYSFPGLQYTWENCAPGTCMSPVISLTDRACILGLHVGGNEISKASFACTITQEQLQKAEEVINNFPSVLPMSEISDFPRKIYGKEILEHDLKSKSIFLRNPERKVICFGSSMNVNRTPKTQVRNLRMKEDVRNVFELSVDWAGPKFHGPDGKSKYHPWESGYLKWTKEKEGVPFTLLNRASTDYKNGLIRKMLENFQFWKDEIRVLTWDETINGIPGKRFVGPINFSSSIGYPLKGSKNEYAVNHGSYEQWQDYRTLDSMIMERAKEVEELYRSGRRSYDIYTSTLKDEPTLTTKDKVRVFQASSIANQLVIRRYTLAICRFLQLNPLVSECAVGIDPKSSEWHELAIHLRATQGTFSRERYLAMDYKAFDTSISSQVILAIGKIYLDIAKMVGFAEEDLSVITGIFNELAFPVVDFNGDVLMLDGCNPSGNPLTVFINNITNSLTLRMFWFTQYTNPFRDYVHIVCYGDDICGSVSPSCGRFNMITYRDWASRYGLTVTSADKEGELKDYAKFAEIDFLKRKFVWSKDLKRYVGPIQEESIYRSLCQYMKSDTDESLIAASNIDGALDEWFFHGREIFENRQRKIIPIAQKFGLEQLCNRLHLSYDQRRDDILAAALS